MKNITLQNYTGDKYYLKIAKAVDTELKSQNFVAPLRVFISLGLLENHDVDDWRKGRIPYLERAVKCNLVKASRILRILSFHAHHLNLKPSMTVYKRNSAGAKIPLRFSKSGERNIEESYSRHFVKLGDSNAMDPRSTDPRAG
jgi:hypothetical protein